jgi:alkaline phosphatase D
MLHNSVSSYFMKDDHDITKNDAYPGVDFRELTWEQGLEIFDEQFPIGELPYRTVRWGKDLQVWFMEGRNYRSPNDAPDGPEKTIWGAVQKQWFYDTVAESDATFKLVVSPTPIVGPDRLHNKADNHANAAFSHEGNEIRTFISEQPNMFVANGDRHWQYYSIDDETGVREFSVGPHSNKHAAGYSMEKRTSEHQFLRINGGFLVVEVTREEGSPTISFKHYDVDGMVVNDEVFTD